VFLLKVLSVAVYNHYKRIYHATLQKGLVLLLPVGGTAADSFDSLFPRFYTDCFMYIKKSICHDRYMRTLPNVKIIVCSFTLSFYYD